MTVENYGSIWQLDQCCPLSAAKLTKQRYALKATQWVNLRPMFSGEKKSKGLIILTYYKRSRQKNFNIK